MNILELLPLVVIASSVMVIIITTSFRVGQKIYDKRLRENSKSALEKNNAGEMYQSRDSETITLVDVHQPQPTSVKTISRLSNEDICSNLKKQQVFNQLIINAHELDSLKIEVDEKPIGTELICQDSESTEVHFIFDGKCEVRVNTRKVAERAKHECVGESCAINSVARRSASVIVTEHAVIAKMPAESFLKIIGQSSQGWKNLATMLAYKLRERNRFCDLPRKKKAIFIASSSESKKTASLLKVRIEKEISDCEVKLWTEVFPLGSITIEKLIAIAQKGCDFAICVLTGDDKTNYRGQKVWVSRDNVVFEFGLFVGAIGKDRAFMMLPSKGKVPKLPTDVSGVTYLPYSFNSQREIFDDDSIKKLVADINHKGVM